MVIIFYQMFTDNVTPPIFRGSKNGWGNIDSGRYLQLFSEMPRKVPRKAGSTYGSFEEKDMASAVAAVRDGMPKDTAAKTYGVPRTTLIFRCKRAEQNLIVSPPGRPKVFDGDEEELMVTYVQKMAEWGYPVSVLDLRLLAKSYLDRRGVNDSRFKSNFPGDDWAQSFLDRHSEQIRQRVVPNVPRSRAAIGPEIIRKYFENLTESIKDVPPVNIFNYDETNVSDDPGKRRILCKRGTKYITNICNFSKTSTSVMFCGSASGVLLPPYVVYKAENLWANWLAGGPKGPPCCPERCCRQGTRYNRSKSGWFDSVTFRDWFKLSFLPHAKALPGKKVLIGDNLSSHFSDEVLKLCEENDIAFICLPANSTHLLQPLDVSFFGPFKRVWRATLLEWKEGNRRSKTLPKEMLPELLAKSLKNLSQIKIEQDIKSGFRGSGIFPLNSDEVLKKIPEIEPDDTDSADEATGGQRRQRSQHLVETIESILEGIRYPPKSSREPSKRRKVDCEPGKSVAAAAAADTSFDSEEEEERDDEAAGTSVTNRKSRGDAPAKFLAEKKKKAVQQPLVTPEAFREVEQVPFESLKQNDFLTVIYDSHWWICRIEKIGEEEIFAHFMSPHGPKTQFHWPAIEDSVWVPQENFIARLRSAPVPRGSRNFTISAECMDAIEDLFIDSLTSFDYYLLLPVRISSISTCCC